MGYAGFSCQPGCFNSGLQMRQRVQYCAAAKLGGMVSGSKKRLAFLAAYTGRNPRQVILMSKKTIALVPKIHHKRQPSIIWCSPKRWTFSISTRSLTAKVILTLSLLFIPVGRTEK
jgi:hypothetical protein